VAVPKLKKKLGCPRACSHLELLIRSSEDTGEVHISNYSLKKSTESTNSVPHRQIETEEKSSKFYSKQSVRLAKNSYLGAGYLTQQHPDNMTQQQNTDRA